MKLLQVLLMAEGVWVDAAVPQEDQGGEVALPRVDVTPRVCCRQSSIMVAG